MRPLALHVSALSDSEYDLYTASFRDLALDGSSKPEHDGSSSIKGGRGGEDAYFEGISVGVRELRGWLRGRYAHVQTADIDSILRLFCPTLSPTATLTGAEFFAALRLVVHAENGRDVERSLAFVQANPGACAGAAPVRPLHRSAPASPEKRYAELPLPQQPPPPMPSRRFESGIPLPPPVSAPAASSSRTSHNPFTTADLSVANVNASGQQPPPLHPSQRSESGRSVTSQSHPTHSAHNPFAQARSSRSDDGSGSAPNPQMIPPLPPRKAAPPVPPPRIPSSRRGERSLSPSKPLLTPHPLLSNTAPSLIHPHPQATTAPFTPPSTSTHTPPTIPPKPPHHVTSTLMKQSLHASKVAQSMKRAEEVLERERVMSVLKRSSHHGPGSGPASTSTSGTTILPPPPQYAYAPRRTGASPHRPGTSASYDASSASSASGSVERERERTAPPLPRRRNTHSQHPSPPMSAVSAGSMERVALAGRGGGDVDFDREGMERARERDTRKGIAWDHERDWDGQRGSGLEQSPFKSPTNFVSVDHGYYGGSPMHSPSRSRQQSPQRPHSNANGIAAEAPPMHPDRKPYLGGYQAPSTSANTANEKSEFDRVYGVSDRTFSGSTSAGGGGGGGEREMENVWDNARDRERDRDWDRTRPSAGESSPTMRVFRSKSMHYTSSHSSAGSTQLPVPQQAPPPPLRRKRPESVQVLGSGGGGGVGSLVQAFNAAGSNSNDGGGLGRYRAGLGLGAGGGVGGMGGGIGKGTGKGVTRRSSLSVSTTPTSDPSSPFYSGADGQGYEQQSPTRFSGVNASSNLQFNPTTNSNSHLNSTTNPTTNPLSSLHRTFTSLQPKFESLNMSIQPKLDKARYKAEAGIARRGFIPSSHARGGAHGGGFGGEGEKEGLMYDDYGSEGWRERERERSGRGIRGSEDSVGMGMDMDAGGPDVDSPPSSPSDDEDPRMRGVGGVGGGTGARGRGSGRVGGEGGTGGGRGVEKDNLKWPVGPGEGWRPL